MHHKNFTIFVFVAVFLTLFSSGEDSIVELPPYQVKSYWFEHPSGSDHREYSHADVGKYHSSDLASVLQQAAPDVGIIRKAGTSNDIIVRGLSQDNLSLTIDDGMIFACCSNRMDPPISQVSSAMIQTIELTQGAFDLKSTGSLGGSVRIVTKEPSSAPSLNASLLVGSYEQLTSSLSVTAGNDDFESIVIAEFSESHAYKDGQGVPLTDFPESTDWIFDDYLQDHQDFPVYKTIHANGKLKWLLQEKSYIQASYRYRHDKDVLYPGLRMDADRTLSHELAFTYHREKARLGSPQFEFQVYHNWTDHDMRDSHRKSSMLNPSGKSRPAYVIDRGWFMESLAEASTTGFQVFLSQEVDSIQFESGLLAVQRKWDINNRLGAGSPYAGSKAEIFNDMIPETVSQVVGAFSQADIWLRDSTRLDLGIRMDHFYTSSKGSADFLMSQVGSFQSSKEWMPSAKLVIRQNIRDSWAFFSGIGSTVRIANGQERYIQLKKPGTMANWLGNPRLKSPRNTELVVGVSRHSDWMTFNAKCFYSFLSDYIYIGKLIPLDSPLLLKNTQTYFNLDARLYGMNTSLNLRLGDHWSLYSGISWQKGQKKSLIPHNQSEHLGEIPPVKGMVSLQCDKDWFGGHFECQFAGSQKEIDSFVGEKSLGSYLVLNLRSNIKLGEHLTLGVGVENILNRTYASHNALVRNPFSSFSVVNEPGRLLYLNLRAQW